MKTQSDFPKMSVLAAAATAGYATQLQNRGIPAAQIKTAAARKMASARETLTRMSKAAAAILGRPSRIFVEG